ncbi:MAG: ThuA domain-containing protein [Treponema sp.]|nr:ThuA domain-containing protein [Treponema sp.]
MKVLLICDDYWHPGQTAIDGIVPLENNGFQFTVIKNANDISADTLKQYPVILICKSDEVSQSDKQPWRTDDNQKIFVDYVENGGGLVAVHSALVNSKNYGVFDELIGCRFLGHPNNCPVTVQVIKPHPVTEGVGQFIEVDEHYKIEITRSDADVIAASYSPAQGEESKYQEDPYFNTACAIYPAAYARAQGKGRVCVLTPGHLTAVWLNPQFQKMLSNALNWTSGKQ